MPAIAPAPLAAPLAAPLTIPAQPAVLQVDPAASLVTPAPPGNAPMGGSDVTGIPGTPDANPKPLPALTTATPVVVELFTAEGCTSCLPADGNANAWAGRRTVLVLTYHVDYWDYIGWRDTKAETAFAARQEGYMTALGHNMVYTPQLVIGGKDDELGTDKDRLATALADSRHISGMIPLRWLKDAQGQVLIDLPMTAMDKPVTLWLITYRRQVETDIVAGENAGKHLLSLNVVRSVQKLGTWSGLATHLPVPIDRQAGGDVPADAAAIVVNQAEFGPVIAATAIAFSSLN